MELWRRSHDLLMRATNHPRATPAVALSVLVLLVANAVVLVADDDDGLVPVAAALRPTTTVVASTLPEITFPPTTAPPTTVTTLAPPPTTAAPPPPPPTTVAPPRPVPAAGAWSLEPYRGLGAWIDVYDWTHEFTNGNPRVGPERMGEVAANGIQTIYIQTAHYKSGADVIEPERLAAIIDGAHRHGMLVVGWYLPTFEDLDLDLRRILAGAGTGLDGYGVDIESRKVADHAERNRRLLDLSGRLRAAMGDKAISAITPSSVHLQVVNPSWWPDFPWVEVAAIYDAIAPMAYWTVRKGEYRDAERYIAENIDRIRASTGNPQQPVHPIGGIANAATAEDIAGFTRAAQPRGVLGVSLYDFNTSNAGQWQALAGWRR